MKQVTLGARGFEKRGKATRHAQFLADMNRVVPWAALCALIEPFYSKGTVGRPPVGVERMLRIYFSPNWFNLSDPAVEEALYDMISMGEFVDIDLGREPAPDDTTILRFWHLPTINPLPQLPACLKVRNELLRHRHLLARLRIAAGS